MSDPTPITFAVVCALLAIFVFGGFVKGAAGFGQPMMTIPLASLLLDVPTAIALTIAPVYVSNIVQFIQNRRAIGAVGAWWPFYLTLTLAMLVGLVVLSSAGHERLLVLIGALILVFVAVQFTRWQPRIEPPMSARVQVLVAGVSGLLGGMTSFVSFPALPALVACRLPREEFALVICVMFLLAATVLSTGLSLLGVFRGPVLLTTALCVLPTVAGQVLGQKVRDRLPARWLRLVVFTMLGVMGVSLIVRGVI